MSIVNYISGICCYIIKLIYKENILSAQRCFLIRISWLKSENKINANFAKAISFSQAFVPNLSFTLKVFTLILRVNAFLLLDAYVK